MFRFPKAPIIAPIVGVAFTCYIVVPGRFRTEKVEGRTFDREILSKNLRSGNV